MRTTDSIAVLIAMAGWASAQAQTGYAEVEPNDNKTQATVINGLLSGDTITGNTTGNSTTVPGAGSADYFKIKTAPQPLGIYRYRLLFTSPTIGHTGSVRGLIQSLGAITPNSDVAVQSTSSSTIPQRMLLWFGFGREEQLYFRVTGLASTTSNYTGMFDSSMVTPLSVGTSFVAGSISIYTVGQTTVDTDLWVYDANLVPIANFGNDDEGPAGPSTQSRLTRTFTPGTYYLAISDFDLVNNLASPTDDDNRSGGVVDFPDSVLNSSILGTAAAPLNVSFRILDSASTSVLTAASKAQPYDVIFAKFVVAGPPPFCYPNCDNSSAPPILNSLDFGCFLSKFAAGDSYANCDGSTAPPTLNALDFGCFLSSFAAGCT